MTNAVCNHSESNRFHAREGGRYGYEEDRNECAIEG